MPEVRQARSCSIASSIAVVSGGTASPPPMLSGTSGTSSTSTRASAV
ncbi:hypothetical protein [Streptomyces sp. NPDC002671]